MVSDPGRNGLALILSRDEPGAVRSALSLALAAIAMGDSATVFFTQTGVRFLRRHEQDVSLVELRAMAQAEGVRFIACADSVAELSLTSDDLVVGIEFAGAAVYYQCARSVAVSLYI